LLSVLVASEAGFCSVEFIEQYTRHKKIGLIIFKEWKVQILMDKPKWSRTSGKPVKRWAIHL
jgi:hypothetical protein